MDEGCCPSILLLKGTFYRSGPIQRLYHFVKSTIDRALEYGVCLPTGLRLVRAKTAYYSLLMSGRDHGRRKYTCRLFCICTGTHSVLNRIDRLNCFTGRFNRLNVLENSLYAGYLNMMCNNFEMTSTWNKNVSDLSRPLQIAAGAMVLFV